MAMRCYLLLFLVSPFFVVDVVLVFILSSSWLARFLVYICLFLFRFFIPPFLLFDIIAFSAVRTCNSIAKTSFYLPYCLLYLVNALYKYHIYIFIDRLYC